jgi:hypothetical protein
MRETVNWYAAIRDFIVIFAVTLALWLVLT